MSLILVHIFRFVVAMAGYAAAVIVAVVISVGLFALLANLFDPGGNEPFLNSPDDLVLPIEYGLIVTAVFAFPGFVIALVLSIVRQWKRWWFFAVAGAANAIFSLAIFGAYGNGSIMPIGLILPCLPGGLAGGYVYWLVAGRFLARHRAAAT